MISKSVAPRLALLCALDTKGQIYYSLSQSNTDSDMMMLYMRHLLRRLDEEEADWRDNTVFLFDGAKYHTSEEMKAYFRKMDIKVIYSGPYSYTSAPIELVFGALKQGELNPDRHPTGKRVSDPSFLTDSLVFRQSGGHDRRAARTDPEEHVHQVLAPHDAVALQVPGLRADLTWMDPVHMEHNVPRAHPTTMR